MEMQARNFQSRGSSGSPNSSISAGPTSSFAKRRMSMTGTAQEQRTKTLRIAGEHVGDEEAAVRCAGGGDAAGSRDPASDKIGGDGGEVVVGKAPAFAARGLVPGRAEFASAADMREDTGAAALEPQLAERRIVPRTTRNTKH